MHNRLFENTAKMFILSNKIQYLTQEIPTSQDVGISGGGVAQFLLPISVFFAIGF